MLDLLNYGFAWLSALLAVVLSVILITRKLILISSGRWKAIFIGIDRSLGVHQKSIGVLLVLSGLIHGLASGVSLLSLNVGTLCLIVSFVFGLNGLLKDHYKKKFTQAILCGILAILLIGTLIWHVVDVGGIRVFEVLQNSGNKTHIEADFPAVTATGNINSTEASNPAEPSSPSAAASPQSKGTQTPEASAKASASVNTPLATQSASP